MSDDKETALGAGMPGLGDEGELGSLGSLETGLGGDMAYQFEGLGDFQEQPDLDSQVHELMAQGQTVEPEELLPCTPETMLCLRGPCEHFWESVTPQDSNQDLLMVKRTQYCTRHQQLLSLEDRNVFVCGQWWPAVLVIVPKSLRPLLRDKLRRRWDAYLKARGGDFSWRWWPENLFSRSPEEYRQLRAAAIKKKQQEKASAEAQRKPLDEMKVL